MERKRPSMSFISFTRRNRYKVELRPKHCIDTVLKPLTDNINIKINGALNCKDLFYTAICMAVNNSSVHSISKHYQEIPCETSLRYHLKKLDIEELMRLNESQKITLRNYYFDQLIHGTILSEEEAAYAQNYLSISANANSFAIFALL